ncbi:hypothetical protein ACTNCI_09595 [Mitsuokella jalaludinii]|uniref:hypothetical protein n=1 Tax=Mitsuokella jalaludinii TaxID=187979 RepID=UPI003F8BB132
MKPLTPEEAVKVDRYPVYIGGVQLEKNLQPFMDALRGRPVVEDKWDCPADWDFQFSLTRDFGFSFTKGSMPFHAVMREDESGQGNSYLDITSEAESRFDTQPDLDQVHCTIPVDPDYELDTIASFREMLDDAVSQAFYDGRLNLELLQPHNYGLKEETLHDVLRALNDCLTHPDPSRKGESIAMCDIGNVRMQIENAEAALYNEDSAFYVSLRVMRFPYIPDEGGSEERQGFNLPMAGLRDCRNDKDLCCLLECQLTAASRKTSEELLEYELMSKSYNWMIYELEYAKELRMDGYVGQDGKDHPFDAMTYHEKKQFGKVLGEALLRETPSKTLWLGGDEPFPLDKFRLIGVYEDAMPQPAFGVILPDTSLVVVGPEAIIPSQMRLDGCPYTEKEYGIPLEKIPAPIQERGTLRYPYLPAQKKRREKETKKPQGR